MSRAMLDAAAPRDEGAELLAIGFRDLFGFLLRGGAIAVALLLGVVPATYAWSLRQPARFVAEATLLVPVGAPRWAPLVGVPAAPPTLDLGAYRVAVVSEPVLREALRALGSDEPTDAAVAALRAALSTSITVGLRDSSLVRVRATGPAAQVAAERADAAAGALVAWERARARAAVGRAVAALEAQIDVLDVQVRSAGLEGVAAEDDPTGLVRLRTQRLLQLANARTWATSIPGALQVLEGAGATVVQTAPRPLLHALVAALLATALAYGALLAHAALDTRLRRGDAVGGLPLLAQLPVVRAPHDPRLAALAAYLRAELSAATPGARPRVLLVTSARAGEGKSTVARLLAESFVRSGARTLLVDADLRTPALAGRLIRGGPRTAEGPSTEAWLRDPSLPGPAGWIDLPGVGRLHVALQPQPVAGAADLVARGFAAALARWSDFDAVVVDAPAVGVAADPLSIAPHCSGTLWVVDPRRSDARSLHAAIGALRRSGGRIVGGVANRVAFTDGSTEAVGPPRFRPAPRGSARRRPTGAAS